VGGIDRLGYAAAAARKRPLAVYTAWIVCDPAVSVEMVKVQVASCFRFPGVPRRGRLTFKELHASVGARIQKFTLVTVAVKVTCP